MIGLVSIISLLLLVSMPFVVVAKPLPPNCDESSDDKECKDFQIIVNKSHSELDKFNKEVLPKIIEKIKLKAMGLESV
jgi:hypothetical protein